MGCAFMFKPSGFWKKVYKILGVALGGCWIVLACFLAGSFVGARYLYPLKYKQTVFKYADAYGISRPLVFSVIRTESGFNKNVKSQAGAVGLMQITPSTGAFIADRLAIAEYDLYDPETNVNFGCYYIRYLLNRFPEQKTALCAYNAGEGNVRAWLGDIRYSKDGKSIDVIPFAETAGYIEKIYESFGKYKKIYGNILDK